MKKITMLAGALLAGLCAYNAEAQTQTAVGRAAFVANTDVQVSGAPITRPANTTAYAVGQLVANDTVAANVAPIPIAICRASGDVGLLKGLRVEKSSPNITNASFRIHLFRIAPTMTNGDGGVYLPANGRASAEIGYFDVTMDLAYGDGAKGTVAISERGYTCPPTAANLYALIEARGAYTPVSGEVFNVAFEARH
ncbi:hypothetical protein PQI07_22470 [Methylobacterium sp. 092160098-2]|uniref:hypothetical protein n=1 Tax=Methylobacterium sp. 092160098-2 TaxID=3025129 RepID=UPI002381C9A2|nr:hypothetical protein [Methylobacterium sp. 092160098-2]MDE4913448.1 hypothetical protein [Methylobacterium sp. 092160098-2]